jgi:membrane-bound ClpP family serine protease
MTPSIVILLLIIAIGLILLEIFFIPGVGVVGIAGAALMVISLGLAYHISTPFGHYTLAGTAVASAGLIVLSLRAKTWDRMSLKSELSGHVDTPDIGLSIGDSGKAISRLNPIGKAMFNNHMIEVRSKGTYIEADASIEIVNIEGTKITVIKI